MNLLSNFISSKNQTLNLSDLSNTLNYSIEDLHIEMLRLQNKGVCFKRIDGDTYQLISTQTYLDVPLLSGLIKNTHIEIYESLESTNTSAKSSNNSPALIIAKKQTAGKGRRGRQFYSPQGTGLYMSYISDQRYKPSQLPTIIMKTAVALKMSIKTCFNIDCDIKWLNDIYYKDLKVAGILVEGTLNSSSPYYEQLIIGVGLNLQTDIIPESLQNIMGSLDLNHFDLYHLIAEWIYLFNTLDDQTVSIEYQKDNYTLNKTAILYNDEQKYKVIKINNDGSINIVDEYNNQQTVHFETVESIQL